jgi:cytochrome c553
MIWAFLLFAQSAASTNDALVIERGAELYRMHCAVPFCHGADGTAGRAPALAGRNFEPEALLRAITHGIPARGMPSFQSQLGDDGVKAVFTYVRNLRSPEPVKAAAKVAPIKLSKEAVAGRDLFFDSSRLPSCSDCHAAGHMGASIASRLTSIEGVDTLRRVRAAQVHTVQMRGEPEFPAIVGQVTSDSIRLYDLSASLPVLRTFPKSLVTLKENSAWSHTAVVERYTQRELELIVNYLRAVQ